MNRAIYASLTVVSLLTIAVVAIAGNPADIIHVFNGPGTVTGLKAAGKILRITHTGTVGYSITLAADRHTSERLIAEALTLAGSTATSNARKGAFAECVITKNGKVISSQGDAACSFKRQGTRADITCKAVHTAVCRVPPQD